MTMISEAKAIMASELTDFPSTFLSVITSQIARTPIRARNAEDAMRVTSVALRVARNPVFWISPATDGSPTKLLAIMTTIATNARRPSVSNDLVITSVEKKSHTPKMDTMERTTTQAIKIPAARF